MSIRVLIADDHPAVRQGVRRILSREGLDVVAEAGDGREALLRAAALRPDVAVLDLSMPLLSGLEAAGEIARASPETKVVILTQHDEESYILDAMKAGVHGYVLKSQPSSDLIQAVRDVQRGRLYLSPAVSSVVIRAYRACAVETAEALSDRELEVLKLLAEGRTTKHVAQRLGLTDRTVASCRGRIMLKLGIHDIAGLVRYAVRRGLLDP